MKSIVIILACLGITACKDRGMCLQAHNETMTQWIYILGPDGSIQSMIPTFVDITVCDRWQYPEGVRNDS